MSETGGGTVITFYSYKGGTGRTMALANVAWILAANGHRVLVVDWDLESPGLHRFFKPFLSADFAAKPGVIQLIQEFEWAAGQLVQAADEVPEEPVFTPDMLSANAAIDDYVTRLDWSHFPGHGRLDYLAAGRQNLDYATTLSGLNWEDFYTRFNGGQFIQTLRATMKRDYDYTLIDSRTGFSDIADICTVEMPDILVDCFTLSEQGIEGAAQVAKVIQSRHGSRNIRILPVAMRVDPAEKAKVDAGRLTAKHRFAGLPVSATPAERDRYWASAQVPYQAYYGYEEMLATFGDAPGTTGLLSAYETLTSYITDGAVCSLPPIDETLRERVNASFLRTYDEIVLHYAPEDQVWADWIAHVLIEAEVRVAVASARGLATAGEELTRRDLVIVSNVPFVESSPHAPALRDALAVYVADLPTLRRLPTDRWATVAGQGQSEATAVEQILELVGRTPTTRTRAATGRPRFPGLPPNAPNLPARYLPFTGREADLHELRQQLTSGGARTGAHVLVLQGLSGIGKTQLALEYAHRFRSAYDVVWWVKAHPVAFIDVQLGDLGPAIGISPNEDAAEAARAVILKLSTMPATQRWLLILDNAEDVERVSTFVPSGTGHILITSRNARWSLRAPVVEVNVFPREESVEHLRSRVPAMTSQEADDVATAVGDMPFAIAAAAAYIAETGMPTADYIKLVERSGPVALPSTEDGSDDADSYANSAISAWLLSLDALRERSPVAYRLFELCCVLDQEIAFGLIYNEEIVSALKSMDPLLERNVLPSLVQQANRLQLLKVDPRGEGGDTSQRGQVVVHTLMQQLVRARLSPPELTDARHQMHLVLARLRPAGEVDNPDTWPRFRMLWSHLEVSGAVNCGHAAVRELLIDRVRYLWLRGDFERGLDRATQTERAWADRLPVLDQAVEESAEPNPVAESLQRQLLLLRFNKGNILRDLGRFEESWAVDAETLAAQTEALGPTHPDTLLTAGGLAADLRALGRYVEALEFDRETYAAWTAVYGEEHTRTLSARNNLAVSFRLMGDFRRALEHDEAVYRGRYGALGERHPNTLAAAGNIGRDLREAGEYERSVTQLQLIADEYLKPPALPTRNAVLARANLAISLRSAGHAEKAAPLLEEAFEWLNAQQHDAPETLACRLSRALNFLALGDRRAEQELIAVHAAYEASLGALHPHTIGCVNDLALVARSEGRFDEALRKSQAAARDFAAVLNDDSPYTLAAQTNVAVCLAELGRFEEALAIADDITSRSEVVLGETHPDTLRGLANRALFRARLGQPGQDAVVAGLTEQMASTLGDQHPAVSALRQNRYLHRVLDPHPF